MLGIARAHLDLGSVADVFYTHEVNSSGQELNYVAISCIEINLFIIATPHLIPDPLAPSSMQYLPMDQGSVLWTLGEFEILPSS